MQVLVLQITANGPEQITVGGKERSGFAFDVSLAGTTLKMWVDKDGRLLKDIEGGGRLIVELNESEQE